MKKQFVVAVVAILSFALASPAVASPMSCTPCACPGHCILPVQVTDIGEAARLH
jgi:hypothetical protein